jgi:hypothetical protein
MATVRRTNLSPYWQAVLTRADGSRTNRSTKQTEKKKAIEVAAEMQRTIHAAKAGTISREKLFQTFNDLMVRIGGQGFSSVPKSAHRIRSRKSEIEILAELRRRLGR